MKCCKHVLLNCSQVTCATLAGGFWGNHVLHSGVVEFEKATENINSIVKRAQEMTRRYNEVLQKNIEQVLTLSHLVCSPKGPSINDVRQGYVFVFLGLWGFQGWYAWLLLKC